MWKKHQGHKHTLYDAVIVPDIWHTRTPISPQSLAACANSQVRKYTGICTHTDHASLQVLLRLHLISPVGSCCLPAYFQ